jgi:hypothetical protein
MRNPSDVKAGDPTDSQSMNGDNLVERVRARAKTDAAGLGFAS